MPISRQTGNLIYSLIRASRPAVVVEFGMSYGISTLYSAAAIRDNGVGHLYTTEMSSKKIAAAAATFAEARIDDLVTILEGDARETLSTIEGEIGVVLMDGWKDLYLPVLQVLEPKLPTGALIVADNADHGGLEPYLETVRNPANGYTSTSIPGIEHGLVDLSCRT